MTNDARLLFLTLAAAAVLAPTCMLTPVSVGENEDAGSSTADDDNDGDALAGRLNSDCGSELNHAGLSEPAAEWTTVLSLPDRRSGVCSLDVDAFGRTLATLWHITDIEGQPSVFNYAVWTVDPDGTARMLITLDDLTGIGQVAWLPDGGFVLEGRRQYAPDGSGDAIVAGYDPSGERRWEQRAETLSAADDCSRSSLATSDAGDIAYAVPFPRPTEDGTVGMRSIDKTGALRWELEHEFGHMSSLVLDSSGTTYAVDDNSVVQVSAIGELGWELNHGQLTFSAALRGHEIWTFGVDSHGANNYSVVRVHTDGSIVDRNVLDTQKVGQTSVRATSDAPLLRWTIRSAYTGEQLPALNDRLSEFAVLDSTASPIHTKSHRLCINDDLFQPVEVISRADGIYLGGFTERMVPQDPISAVIIKLAPE